MKKLLFLLIAFLIIHQAESQAIRWGTRSFSGTGNTEESKAIATDSLGNSYITGFFNDTLKFGTTTLGSRGLKDIFVAKLDANGNFIWAKSFGGTSNDEGYAIAVDFSGNIFVTGYYTTKMYFTASDSLMGQGGADIFIAKLDNNGNLLLKITEGTPSSGTNDYGRAIAINHANGNFAVVGDQASNLYFFAKKYNSSGVALYSKLFSATTAFGLGVCFDDSDKLYVCGYYTGNFQESPATAMLNSDNGQDGFYLVFSASGTSFAEYKGYGGTGVYAARSIKAKRDGSEFYVSGDFRQSNWVIGYDMWSNQVVLTGSGTTTYAFVEKLNSTGTTLWAAQGNVTSYPSLALDRYNNVFVTSGTSVTYKYNSYGGLSWSSIPGGTTSNMFSVGLDTDKEGNVYTSGRYSSTNIIFGDSTLTGPTGFTAFVQKISSVRITSPAPGTDFCISTDATSGGGTINVAVSPTLNYNSGNVFTLQMDNTTNGAFSSPVNIGTLNGTGSGTIIGNIPPGTAVNNIYLRVITSSPASTMGDETYLYTLDKPIAVISPSSVNRCPGASSNLLSSDDTNPNTGSWGTNYSWSTGSTAQNINVAPSTTTSYIVTITDVGNGCIGRDTVLVNVYPAVSVSLTTSPNYICRGKSDTLHAIGTNVSTYAWTPSATLTGANTANPIATPTASTTYTCNVTSPNGCTASSSITVNSPQTTANAGPVSYNTCLGGSVPLSGSGTWFGGGSNHIEYSWTPTTNISNSDTSAPSVFPNTTTKYYLTTIDSIYGCEGKDSINIIVGPVALTANDVTITCGNNASLLATPVGNYVTPLSYSWSPATNLTSTTTASTSSNTISSRMYYVTMTTGNGCSGTDSALVTVNSPNYNIAFSSTQQLFTSPPFAVQFTNSTPSMSNYNFTWLWGDGTSSQSNNTTVFHVYDYNGSYDVTLIAVNITTGCSDTLTLQDYIFCTGGVSCNVTSTVNTPEGISACTGDTILLTCNTNASFTYQWNLNGSPISGATSSSYEAVVGGNYSVTIDDGSCSVISQPVSISFDVPPSAPTITPSGSLNLCSGGGSVFLNASGGFTSYYWNTGETTQNISVTQSGTYTVNATIGGNACVTSAEYTLNATSLPPTEICLVGVDSLTNKNIVIWNPPVSDEIDSFLVYREGSTANVFDLIGSQNYHDFSTFIDNNSNPAQQAYRYKLAIMDTCGIISLMSDYHKTIHLTINQGVGDTWNLIWTHYEGFSYGTYNIYRGDSPSTMTLLTSIASTNSSYTDLTPPVGLIYYQIEVVNSLGCSPASRSFESSRSNIVDGTITGTNTSSLSNTSVLIYPNPATDELFVSLLNFDLKGKTEIELIDPTGRIIQSQSVNIISANQIESYDISNFSRGIYFIRIHSNGAEYISNRVIITR